MGKAKFRSRAEHTLDAKGRLSFPSRWREVLGQIGSQEVVIVPWKSHLRVYPMEEWEIFETKLLSTKADHPGMGHFLRYLIGNVFECSMDKQGRILVPPGLCNEVNLDKDVVLVGMIDWVEIWDRQAWEGENQLARDTFEEHEENLVNLGIFLC